ncbi:cyclin-dependent kinase G-2-like [Henckelia pumila]|uniref:cyclin-dependent kinase G-2-like n=1 Tax=Henckelia pumila TaxID=405737 RepID=UPI003C6DC85F
MVTIDYQTHFPKPKTPLFTIDYQMHFPKPKIACGRADEYEILHEIGRGSYGRVYQAREKKKVQIVAINKKIVHGLSTSSLRKIDILRSLVGCPWFVEFKQVVVDGRKDEDDHVYVVMEFVKNDLRRYMDGMAWAFTEAEVNHSRRVGSLWYKAPKLLDRGVERYSCAVDMWSVGCIMREMLLDQVLFKGTSEEEQLQMILTKHEEEEKFFLVFEEGLHLLKSMLDLDPHSRITAD